jgi:hypothetical protein
MTVLEVGQHFLQLEFMTVRSSVEEFWPRAAYQVHAFVALTMGFMMGKSSDRIVSRCEGVRWAKDKVKVL